ncbi:MAG: hypothetical protein M3015_03035 [Bacteroidota bacterium]|nr:hypothetical protein [Bacteroidota bacterium]
MKRSYFQGLASFGVQYNLNKKIALSFTSVARFGLTSINEEAPVKTKLSSYGLAAGITLQF